jgi:hypothetical protein
LIRLSTTFFVYCPSDFPDQTIPRGLAVEGTNNLEGLMGTSSNFFIGMDTHVLAHAFGLPETGGRNFQWNIVCKQEFLNGLIVCLHRKKKIP